MLATLVTYTLASVAHTLQVINRLLDLEVVIHAADWLRVILGDWVGLYLYWVVIAIGLAIAFTVMFAIQAILKGRKDWLFALGGALAMAVILISMKQLSSLTPIAGARGTVGFLLQCAAGLVGGVCFVKLNNRVR